MSVGVFQHLQAVFDVAEEYVGLAQRRARAFANRASGGKCIECCERRGRAKLAVASAQDELLGLREQFDVADAAAAEFYVEHRIGEFSTLMGGKYLALDRVHILDRGKVEMLAPDERRERSKKRAPFGAVAGGGARLDEGGALPVLPQRLVIMLRRGD